MTTDPASMMRVAFLHGPGDLRVESVAVPEVGEGELLVRVEACGICPTDVRKFEIGTDRYPLNPGHEWVGRVEVSDVDGWSPGDRVYGDTYAGYAELAAIPVVPLGWSAGPVRLPDELPLERAIFVEPLADCLHAVHDRANIQASDRVAVVGSGQMGLQLCAVASLAGARVTAVEPLEERRRMASEFGATDAVERLTDGPFDIVILSVGRADLVEPALRACAPGGRVVLFAGLGEVPRAELDLDLIHYRELVLTGSEWVGTPPNQRRERYGEALELLVADRVPVERLVTSRCGLAELPAAFRNVSALRGLKTVLVFP
jgi:L-iditol 2-dehydrogenase